MIVPLGSSAGSGRPTSIVDWTAERWALAWRADSDWAAEKRRGHEQQPGKEDHRRRQGWAIVRILRFVELQHYRFRLASLRRFEVRPCNRWTSP